MPTTDERKKAVYKFIKSKKQKGESFKAKDVIDHLCDEFSDYSRADHRRFVVQELAGKEVDEEQKEQLTKTCPKCVKDKAGKSKSKLDDEELEQIKQDEGVTHAVGEDEIEELFGFRTMSGGNKRPQSWCKACRNS